jgi:hypothetical protein
MKRAALALAGAVGTLVLAFGGSPAAGTGGQGGKPECADNAVICTEVSESVGYSGAYTGHDEPSLLFYSSRAGTGSSQLYQLTLPTEPPTPPTQSGTGGTFNFQLHPAFWFGMAMCDDQSAPNPGGSPVGPNVPCVPGSDSNIYNSSDPSSPQYIGHHPGTAFMEMQFYPPGWVPFQYPGGVSCSATQWCAALNIDSLSENENTGATLNSTCQKLVGEEYVNFAFITTDGTPQAPPSPVNSTAATFTPDPSRDLFMNGGDRLTVDLHDSAQGLVVVIHDLTTGTSGMMTASAANGFGAVQWAPTGKSCTNVPYDFHPMYSTSSENTRVPWAAHSYNIAFSDEIGHFELCDKVATGSGKCAQPSSTDADAKNVDVDDDFCLPAALTTLVAVSGCADSDVDFDGASYQATWPGTIANASRDASLHPSPILFTSPLSGGSNYERVAFEANMPRIETNTNPPCQRHVSNPADPSPGSGCVNPPAGAAFYPIYSTGSTSTGSCIWQFGGPLIPGTTNTFGGDSASEFGTTLEASAYAGLGDQPQLIYENFRHILSNNPCPAG